MFTQEEIKNLLSLISLAPIKGSDAVTVALLQQKLTQMIKDAKEETKPNKGKQDN